MTTHDPSLADVPAGLEPELYRAAQALVAARARAAAIVEEANRALAEVIRRKASKPPAAGGMRVADIHRALGTTPEGREVVSRTTVDKVLRGVLWPARDQTPGSETSASAA
jgi:hypothetical protein